MLSRVLDGEAVLLDIEGGAYFGLNGVATAAWDQIGAAGITRDALVDALLDRFDVAREIVERDVDALLQKLIERNLVRIA